MCVLACVCVCVCLSMCVCVSVCVCANVCAYAKVPIHVWYRERDSDLFGMKWPEVIYRRQGAERRSLGSCLSRPSFRCRWSSILVPGDQSTAVVGRTVSRPVGQSVDDQFSWRTGDGRRKGSGWEGGWNGRGIRIRREKSHAMTLHI